MTIDATSNARAGSLAGQVTQAGGTPSSTSAVGDMGPDAFMRLLVTQIKNQDPMNPMDSKELMTQLSQLTSVERLVKIDDRLASLVGARELAVAQRFAVGASDEEPRDEGAVEPTDDSVDRRGRVCSKWVVADS